MYKQIAANKRNTVLIMFFFCACYRRRRLGGRFFTKDWLVAVWILIIAIIYAVVQYFASAQLAVAMTGAREIKKKDNPRLYNTVENLSIATGIPNAESLHHRRPAPNALSLLVRDPEHAIVAATTGFLDIIWTIKS